MHGAQYANLSPISSLHDNYSTTYGLYTGIDIMHDVLEGGDRSSVHNCGRLLT